MTQQGPGWYPDPSGLPATFRWWDGRRWTEDITVDPGSAPAGPSAAAGPSTGGPSAQGPSAARPSPAGPSSGTSAGTPQPDDPVPPPPGAPGPGYFPPLQRRDGSSEHPVE